MKFRKNLMLVAFLVGPGLLVSSMLSGIAEAQYIGYGTGMRMGIGSGIGYGSGIGIGTGYSRYTPGYYPGTSVTAGYSPGVGYGDGYSGGGIQVNLGPGGYLMPSNQPTYYIAPRIPRSYPYYNRSYRRRW